MGEAVAVEAVTVEGAPTEGAPPADAAAELPARRTILESVTLVRQDWKGILRFFNDGQCDLDGASAFIEAEFKDYPVIVHQCRLAISAIRLVRAGEAPDLSRMRFVNVKPVANFLTHVGELAVLRSFLQVSAAKWNWRRGGEVEALLSPPGITLPPLRMIEHPWRDWQVFDRKAQATVILFCGASGKFGVELNLLLPWLSDLPCNIIVARDIWQKLYLRGIRSLAGDLPPTIEAIRFILARLGTRRLVTAGNSGGVYAALNYGRLLGADQVLCFSGPATLDAGFEEMEDRPVYESISQAVAEGTLVAPDLLAEIAAQNLPVRYFYGGDNRFDAGHAARLRPLPSVSVEPIEGWDGHFILAELVRRGQFKSIWRDAVGRPTP